MRGERRFFVILGALRSPQHLWEYEAMQSGADTEVRLDMPKGLEIFCILVSTENVASEGVSIALKVPDSAYR